MWLAIALDNSLKILSLPQISQPTIALLRQILFKDLRTVFSSNPHPHFNIKTGKKLARPAGGPNAVQDYYEEQVWKNYPGMWSVLSWVVKNISVSSCATSRSSLTQALLLFIRQSTSSKVFELFPSCCTLSHKENYCGQVSTSLYFPCISLFILRCEYYSSPSHSKLASSIWPWDADPRAACNFNMA